MLFLTICNLMHRVSGETITLDELKTDIGRALDNFIINNFQSTIYPVVYKMMSDSVESPSVDLNVKTSSKPILKTQSSYQVENDEVLIISPVTVKYNHIESGERVKMVRARVEELNSVSLNDSVDPKLPPADNHTDLNKSRKSVRFSSEVEFPEQKSIVIMEIADTIGKGFVRSLDGSFSKHISEIFMKRVVNSRKSYKFYLCFWETSNNEPKSFKRKHIDSIKKHFFKDSKIEFNQLKKNALEYLENPEISSFLDKCKERLSGLLKMDLVVLRAYLDVLLGNCESDNISSSESNTLN